MIYWYVKSFFLFEIGIWDADDNQAWNHRDWWLIFSIALRRFWLTVVFNEEGKAWYISALTQRIPQRQTRWSWWNFSVTLKDQRKLCKGWSLKEFLVWKHTLMLGVLCTLMGSLVV